MRDTNMSDITCPIVVFEGLDHTGKTTNARRLAEEVGGVYMHSPPDEMKPYRAEFDSMDPISNLEFYMTCNRIMDIKIRKAASKQPVMVDRHFFSTVAAHSVILDRDLSSMLSTMRVKLDRVYFMTAELDTIEQRIERTGKKNPRFSGRTFLMEAGENYKRMLKGYPVLEIDTTNTDEEGVYKIVLDDFKRILL
jgi:thymidylate kinase